MNSRAKVTVNSVARNINTQGVVMSETIRFNAVYSSVQNSENYKFWTATPMLNMEMTINNPDMLGKFVPGQEYYLDFSPVMHMAEVG